MLRQQFALQGRQLVERDLHPLGEQPGQHVVEVVAAQRLDAGGVEDRELGAVDAHERGVEGAAAEVEHEDGGVDAAGGRAIALGEAVGVLDGGRGWLAERADDIEAGLPERRTRRPALRAVGVGRPCDDRLEGLVLGEQPRGLERAPERVRESRQEIESVEAVRSYVRGDPAAAYPVT